MARWIRQLSTGRPANRTPATTPAHAGSSSQPGSRRYRRETPCSRCGQSWPEGTRIAARRSSRAARVFRPAAGAYRADQSGPGARRCNRTSSGTPSSCQPARRAFRDSAAWPTATPSIRSGISSDGSAGWQAITRRGRSGSNRSSDAQQQQRRGRRPRLRRARRRVRDRVRRTPPVEPAEQLGQPAAEASRPRRAGRATTRWACGDEPVAHQPGGDDGVVVRPDRAVVVAHRVVGAHGRGQRAHAPTAEHLRAESAARRPAPPCSSSTMPVHRQWPMLEASASTGRLSPSSASA